jgi:hypothetical protein
MWVCGLDWAGPGWRQVADACESGIYFNFCTCFGQLCAHHLENLPSLCDTGIFHSVRVVFRSAGWNETGMKLESHPNQQTRQPPIQGEKYQCRIDTVRNPDDGHIIVRNI